MTAPKVTEGTVAFNYPTLPKPCETWYKVYGDLSSASASSSPSARRPLVILHGGPGLSHNYLLNLSRLAGDTATALVFYDQVGSGQSTHLREKRLDESFWTVELFMAELDNLLDHLGISSSFDLFGHSWGGMLGSQFAARGHAGLRKLVLGNAPASMPLFVASCGSWRKQLPADVDDAISRHERDGTYEDPEYQAAVTEFYKRFVCRVFPFPGDFQDSIAWAEKDDTVYRTMNGPSEFTVTGNLRTWSVEDQVHKITVPTLLLNADYDEVNDSIISNPKTRTGADIVVPGTAKKSCLYPFFNGIPKVKWYKFSDTSHCTNLEIPEKYCQVIADFLLSSS
ncbi:hypothetical protein PV08_08843 [Exophiala spinifera]|uniref:AB hydrolase-1 domain-containing protein n=1 Tax=Exophiala spinifera TaxID=91928 RepID=A0A0D1ZLF0_9EURO|nr:uncharacterized protein PV08_08843 [Exophiala spinifera]KIW13652.1 hypothetical protein PV08_08843 [Exophiala spinifera]